MNTKKTSYAYRLGQAEVALEYMKKDRDRLLCLLGQAAAIIEEYCDDHASDNPTDITVILPALKAALISAGEPRIQHLRDGLLRQPDEPDFLEPKAGGPVK